MNYSSACHSIKRYFKIFLCSINLTFVFILAKQSQLSSLKILLLEGAPPFKSFTGGDYGNRVSAVNKGTSDLMSSIGAWDLIKNARMKAVKHMQVRKHQLFNME